MSNLENNENIHGLNDKDFAQLFDKEQENPTPIDHDLLKQTINQTQAENKTETTKNAILKPSNYEQQFKKVMDEHEEMMKDVGHECLTAINPATVGIADKIIAHELGQEAVEQLNLNTQASVDNLSAYTTMTINSNDSIESSTKSLNESSENSFSNTIIPDSVTIESEEDKVIKIRETDESIIHYEKEKNEEKAAKAEESSKIEEEQWNQFKQKTEEDFEAPVGPVEVKTDISDDEVPESVKINFEKTDKIEKELEFHGGDTNNKETWPFKERNNSWTKRFANIPANNIPQKINGKTLILDESNIKDYFVQKNRFNALSMTKVALPFSGLTLYIRSFKNSTFVKLIEDLSRWDAIFQRIDNSDEELEGVNEALSDAYLKLRKTELEAIYKHVESIYVVNKGLIETPDIETFYKMIKYPDLQQLYFAVYHGTNKNKRKKYSVTCPNPVIDTETGRAIPCGHRNQVELYDEELVFAMINENFKINEFYKLLNDGYPHSTVLPITKEANKEIERLTSTKTNIVQHVPSVYDYLETMDILLDFIKDPTIELDLNLTLMDAELTEEVWDYPVYDTVKLLKTYLYLKEINFLWVTNEETGSVEYRKFSIDKKQRREMFDILLDLPYDDMLLLTRGKEIINLMTLKSLDYYVPSITCEECKQKIDPVKFNIRQNFFILLSELRKNKGV